MNIWPVMQRELAFAARQRKTYRGRVVVGAITTAALMSLFYVHSKFGLGLLGRSFVMQGFSQVLFWGMFFGGAALTADALSKEKREGTLGLLFLTPLKASEIILAKLFSVALQSIYSSLTFLPLLATPFLFGGTTPGEI